jgi:hypothetical protein
VGWGVGGDGLWGGRGEAPRRRVSGVVLLLFCVFLLSALGLSRDLAAKSLTWLLSHVSLHTLYRRIVRLVGSCITNRLPAGACIRSVSQAHARDGSTGRGAGGEKKARSGGGGWRGGLVVH